MPSVFHQAWSGDNYGSPSTGINFGPLDVSPFIFKLLRVRAVFTTSQPGVDLAPTATVRDQIAWGVQAGVYGYTPLVLPADLGGAAFFWSELLGGDTVASAAWAPATGDFGWADTRVATRTWRSQAPLNDYRQFYVTAGAIAAGAAAFEASYTLEIDISDLVLEHESNSRTRTLICTFSCTCRCMAGVPCMSWQR